MKRCGRHAAAPAAPTLVPPQSAAGVLMNVVEVATAYDVAEITELAAATIVWEYVALVNATP
jgi:hypothetical protein